MTDQNPWTPEPPPAIDHLAAARATRANLEMLTRDAYMQNAPTLIAEAQLDATIAVAEALRALVLADHARPGAVEDIIETWGETR